MGDAHAPACQIWPLPPETNISMYSQHPVGWLDRACLRLCSFEALEDGKTEEAAIGGVEWAWKGKGTDDQTKTENNYEQLQLSKPFARSTDLAAYLLLDKRPEVGCHSEPGRKAGQRNINETIQFQESVNQLEWTSIFNHQHEATQKSFAVISFWKSIIHLQSTNVIQIPHLRYSLSHVRRWSRRHRFQELGRCQGAAALHSWLGAPVFLLYKCTYIWGCEWAGGGGGKWFQSLLKTYMEAEICCFLDCVFEGMMLLVISGRYRFVKLFWRWSVRFATNSGWAKRWFPNAAVFLQKLIFPGSTVPTPIPNMIRKNFGHGCKVQRSSWESNPCIPMCFVHGMVHSVFYWMGMVVHPIGWTGAFVWRNIPRVEYG